jgi:hypothetical protein
MTWLTPAPPSTTRNRPATFAEIGREIGVTEVRARQIVSIALRKLRRCGVSLREWLAWSIERETKQDAPGCSQKRPARGAP